MKYIDAEKLKRLVGELKERAKRNRCDSWGIVPDALEEVEGFIASLQQEHPSLPSNIDEAAEEYSENILANNEDLQDAIEDAFKEGAKWMAEQRQTDVELEEEITRWLEKGDITDTRFDDYGDADIERTARHFYELGLNSGKG